MIEWKFNIGAEVYDKTINVNGMVISRRLEEGCDGTDINYNVCYIKGDGSWVYEWTSGEWLEFGHKDIID